MFCLVASDCDAQGEWPPRFTGDGRVVNESAGGHVKGAVRFHALVQIVPQDCIAERKVVAAVPRLDEADDSEQQCHERK